MKNFDVNCSAAASSIPGTDKIQTSPEGENDILKDEQISVFLVDGILSVKEQEDIINQMANSDDKINQAKELGFDLMNCIQESSFFIDRKVNKEDSKTFDIKMHSIKRGLMRALKRINNLATEYLQSAPQSEDIRDANGLLVQTIKKDKAGNVFETTKYEYDDNKEYAKKSITEDAQGNLKSISEYGKNGIITNKINYNDDYTEQYGFDENGYEIKRTLRLQDGREKVFEGNQFDNEFDVFLYLYLAKRKNI